MSKLFFGAYYVLFFELFIPTSSLLLAYSLLELQTLINLWFFLYMRPSRAQTRIASYDGTDPPV